MTFRQIRNKGAGLSWVGPSPKGVDREMEPPTCEQILDDELFRVKASIAGQWRHGTRHSDIYRRDNDGTFWRVDYRYQHNAEESDLTDGTAKIIQVWPVETQITVIDYQETAP